MKHALWISIVLVAKTVSAGAPIPVEKVVAASDLVAEIQDQMKSLSGFTENEASYAKARENRSISQASGTIACLAQALAEHDEAPQGIAAAALRDSALKLRKPKDREQTLAVIQAMKGAVEGQGAGAAEHDWGKLINMHRMMEEMNGRGAKLRRVLRRSRNPEVDSRHAATQAVLGLAMLADTHEVKNKDEIPEWEEFSRTYITSMSEVATAIKAGDLAAAKKLNATAAKTCTACHEKFRD